MDCTVEGECPRGLGALRGFSEIFGPAVAMFRARAVGLSRGPFGLRSHPQSLLVSMKKLLLALGLIVAICLLYYVSGPSDRGNSAVAGPDAGDDVQVEPTTASLLERESDEGSMASTVRTAAAQADEDASHQAEPEAAPSSTLFTLRGRAIDVHGQPIGGAAVKVNGWRANSDRVLEFGVPDDWEDPQGTTDDDGRFQIAFDPPQAYQFVIDVNCAGFGEVSWRFSSLKPGGSKDLGEFMMQQAGRVTGVLVDEHGEPRLGEFWYVAAFQDGSRKGNAVVDQTTGTFEIESLPPGSVEIYAKSKYKDWSSEAVVPIDAGESATVTLVFKGRISNDQIRVGASWGPLHTIRPDATSFSLTGPGLQEPKGMNDALPGRSGYGGFRGLEPGEYTVTLDDPRFQYESKTGIQPGESVSFKLRGNASLVVDLRGMDGSELADAQFFCVIQGTNRRPNRFSLATLHVEGLADRWHFEGLPAGDYELVVELPGGSASAHDLDPIAPGEVRRVTINLGSVSTISGVVRDERGRPAPGMKVELIWPHEGQDSEFQGVIDRKMTYTEGAGFRVLLDAVTTDAGGSYKLMTARTDPLLVRASNELRATATKRVDLSAGPQDQRLDFELPRLSSVHGRIVGLPEGTSFHGVRFEPEALEIADETHSVLHPWSSWSEDPDGAVKPDGTFVCELSAGRYQPVFMLYPGDGFGVAGVELVRLDDEELVIRAGETLEWTWDAAEVWPPEVQVRVTSLQALGEVEVLIAGHGSAKLEPDGRATLVGVTPGTHVIEVVSTKQNWAYASEPVEVIADHSNEFLVDVPFVEGSLTILDEASSQPLTNTTVSLRVAHGGSLRRTVPLETDASGVLHLTMPPCEFRVDLRRTGGDPEVRDETQGLVRWGLGGPDVSELRLSTP